METQQERPYPGRTGALGSLLDREEITERTDELGPAPEGEVIDLTWAPEDTAHAGAVAAAAAGDLTLEETLADVASSLGYLERSIDEDDYDR